MKHVKHGKKLISLLLSVAVAMSMTLSTVMTPLAASSSVSDLRQKLQELQSEQEKVNQQLKDAQSNKADAEALKTQLEQQKALILSQISNLSEQIGSLDDEILAEALGQGKVIPCAEVTDGGQVSQCGHGGRPFRVNKNQFCPASAVAALTALLICGSVSSV